MLVVSLIEPTYSSPVKDVKEGNFIYPTVHVEYNETNVTDLNIENFTVNIGTKPALINSVSYDGTTSYYTLNITVPSNAEDSKQDIWINVTNNGLWSTDINIEAIWYYTSITTTISATTIPPQPPGPGPSPGPSPIPTQPSARIVNFSTDVDLIKVLLTPSKTEKKMIKISNNGKTKLNLTGKIQDINQLSYFTEGGTEYKFELNVNDTKEIEINFFTKKDQEAGIYPGKVVFTGDGIERTVLVIVEVESEKPLFDVKVETLPEYRMVYPGNKVMAQLTIYNLGKIGRVDVNVEYGIKDWDGNVIISRNETLAVETQVSVVENLNLPSTIKPNSYIFYSRVSYSNVIGTGSDTFLVIERIRLRIPLLYWLLIIIILILMFVLFYKLRKKRKTKKKFRMKKKRK